VQKRNKSPEERKNDAPEMLFPLENRFTFVFLHTAFYPGFTSKLRILLIACLHNVPKQKSPVSLFRSPTSPGKEGERKNETGL
jgi:hypothetical protein